jgi:uncharacterized protein
MERLTQMEELSSDVCRHLLANEVVGRIAFVDDDGYPVVLPVNYHLDGDRIVVRTDPGSKLDRVPLRRVAFEVDHLAPTVTSGWSVLVRGHGREVTSALGPPFDAMRDAPADFWAPGPKQHWLAISIERITGRRIVNHAPAPVEPPGDY